MEEKNRILKQILKEELERLNRIEAVYEDEIKSLQKGSIVYKTIKGKEYAYLQYRNGKKIVSKYIKNEEEIDKINKTIEKRKTTQIGLKRVVEEKQQLLKAIKSLEK